MHKYPNALEIFFSAFNFFFVFIINYCINTSLQEIVKNEYC